MCLPRAWRTLELEDIAWSETGREVGAGFGVSPLKMGLS